MTSGHLATDLERSTERWPDRVAVVDADGSHLTYRELNQRSDALAAALASRGIGPGDRVGLVLPKSLEAVVSLFGIMKTGAAYVPIDVNAPSQRGRQILADCRVRAIVIDRHARAVLPEAGAVVLAVLVVVGADADIEHPDIEITFDAALTCRGPVPTQRDSNDLAYVIYTSGSTGVPKGAMLTHRSVTAFVDWSSTVLQPSPDDRFSSYSPFHFDASVLDLYPPVKHGASIHLIAEAVAKNPRELARFLSERGITMWTSTPSALMMLAQFGQLDAYQPWRLRVANFGGEVFPIRQLRELRRLWPDTVLHNMYGPTEATTACTYSRIPDLIPDDREEPYPIGFPCTHCRALVLDESGREVAADGEGLLHISGPSVFEGYWNRPDETAAVFVEYGGARWYNTGDVVRGTPREGYVYLGRKDRMVKRRGFRIELGEIERALSLHPKVREAAAIAMPDAEAGVRIVAFLSSRDGRPVSLVELKTFLAGKLPVYMSPDRFVFADAMPMTSSGKVDYQTLTRRAA